MEAVPSPRRERAALEALAGALALLVMLGPAAGAEEDEIDESLRWVPSISTFFDVIGQKASGSVVSGNLVDQPFTGSGVNSSATKLAPDTSSSDTDVAPLIGGSLELMTPRLFEDGFRAFIHADGAASFGFNRNLAGERKPGAFVIPSSRGTSDNVIERTVEGQGTRARAQLQRLVLSGGIGPAFTFDLFERRIRIKPSFEYTYKEYEFQGRLHRVVKQKQIVSDDEGRAGFRGIQLRQDTVEGFHGIGPGLEIEADTLRLGPFVLSVYLSGRGYRLLGDLETVLEDGAKTESGTDLCDLSRFGKPDDGVGPPPGTECARWRFELDPWSWRTGVGLRFRWLPR